jgi:BirA family biotin operon repressor/biotin-[acetyl-CoA-carboxylase] ligase
VVYLPETGSTNDVARDLAEAGAPDGTLVITDFQASGRGRLSRRWEAPPGSSLLMSLVFRPDLAPHQLQRLTMICSLAMADAIASVTGLSAGLKWPNDILLGEAKVGGILTEVGLTGERLDFCIVGIGLNVNLDAADLPADLLVSATSLSLAAGGPVARLPLLQAFLQRVDARYVALRGGQSPHREWAERLVTLGHSVIVRSGGRTLEGMAEGVDRDGALTVRLVDGSLERVMAGDVTLREHGQGFST